MKHKLVKENTNDHLLITMSIRVRNMIDSIHMIVNHILSNAEADRSHDNDFSLATI